MTRVEAKQKMSELDGFETPHSYGYIEAGELIDQIYDAHEAELKAKDERIAELEAMVQKMKCCENCDFYPPQKCSFDTQYGCLDGQIPSNWKIKQRKNDE